MKIIFTYTFNKVSQESHKLKIENTRQYIMKDKINIEDIVWSKNRGNLILVTEEVQKLSKDLGLFTKNINHPWVLCYCFGLFYLKG